MRDIIFRGKRIDNGEWVQGYYAMYDPNSTGNNWIRAQQASDPCILGDDKNWHEVDPETVGEFAGLLDKNGARIFEGDIVEIEDQGIKPDGSIKTKYKYVVVYEDCSFTLKGNEDEDWTCHDICIGVMKSATITVIGNIHDNPELVKKEILEEIK